MKKRNQSEESKVESNEFAAIEQSSGQIIISIQKFKTNGRFFYAYTLNPDDGVKIEPKMTGLPIINAYLISDIDSLNLSADLTSDKEFPLEAMERLIALEEKQIEQAEDIEKIWKAIEGIQEC